MLFLSRVKGGIHLSVDNSCDLPTMCVMHKIIGDHKSLWKLPVFYCMMIVNAASCC